MKTYIAILIGVVVLSGVVFGGYMIMKKQKATEVPQAETVVRMQTITGSVTRVFEGDNVIEYSFDIPEGATTTRAMDGALVKIGDATSSYANMYISYEGARGYSAVDYINRIITPHVSVITTTNVVHVGDYDWQMAETQGSEWYIASVANGQWLLIVESRKTAHGATEKMLESLKTR